MGHGLSQQQRQILGIAAHANRLTCTASLAIKGGQAVPRYTVPTVDYAGVKDLQWPLAAHLAKHLPFVSEGATITKSNGQVQATGAFFDTTQRHVKSAKASILRAISGLQRGGWLVLAPHSYPFRWGYVLSDAGLRLGAQYECPFPPALIWRAGLILFPDESPFFHQVTLWLMEGTLTLDAVLACFQQAPHSPGGIRHGVDRHAANERLYHLLCEVDKPCPCREQYGRYLQIIEEIRAHPKPWHPKQSDCFGPTRPGSKCPECTRVAE